MDTSLSQMTSARRRAAKTDEPIDVLFGAWSPVRSTELGLLYVLGGNPDPPGATLLDYIYP